MTGAVALSFRIWHQSIEQQNRSMNADERIARCAPSRPRRSIRLSRLFLATYAIGAAAVYNWTFDKSTTGLNERSSGFMFVSARSDESAKGKERFTTLVKNNPGQQLEKKFQLKGQDDIVTQVAARKLSTAQKKRKKKQGMHGDMMDFSQLSGNNAAVLKGDGGGGGNNNEMNLNYGHHKNKQVNGRKKRGKRGGNNKRKKGNSGVVRVKRGGNNRRKKGNRNHGNNQGGGSWSGEGSRPGKWSGGRGGGSGKHDGLDDWNCPCTYIDDGSWRGGGKKKKIKVCTCSPTLLPTLYPTQIPTQSPTEFPTGFPTHFPTFGPTISPTLMPTLLPTEMPTEVPTAFPTTNPTALPTMLPTAELTFPTVMPTAMPTTEMPTMFPTLVPTMLPTMTPTEVPTLQPTEFIDDDDDRR